MKLKKIGGAITHTVSRARLVRLPLRSLVKIATSFPPGMKVNPLDPHSTFAKQNPPVIFMAAHKFMSLLDGHHRVAGMKAWAEKTGQYDILVDVVEVLDIGLAIRIEEETSEQGREITSAIHKAYREAGVES